MNRGQQHRVGLERGPGTPAPFGGTARSGPDGSRGLTPLVVFVCNRRVMSPADLVREWIRRFNAADVDGLAALYAPDAVNHQVVTEPLCGREAIRELFRIEFARAKMVCLEVNLLESGDWAVLEWRDPLGLRGCGFFQVRDGLIVQQRGYFDQLTFFRIQGLPVPESYLHSR